MRRHAAPSLVALLCLGLLACSGPAGDPFAPGPVCTSDAECDGNRVCFADGCGDPGTSIAVEITPNNRAGQHAQDFAIARVEGSQDFVLNPSTVLAVRVLRAASGDPAGGPPGEPGPYTGRVSVRLSGSSAVIPGLPRTFELSAASSSGIVSLPAASGDYVGTLTPEDPTIPPLRFAVSLAPGEETALTLTLPAEDRLVMVRGRILALQLPLITQQFSVQALDPETQAPLSQPTLTAPLTSGFALGMSASLLEGPSRIRVRVAPVDASSSFPVRSFEVVPVAGQLLELDVGQEGPLVAVAGRVVDFRGAAVGGAAVYLEGGSLDAGSHRSATARTDAKGAFSLMTLPTSAAMTGRLWVVPAARDAAALGLFAVEVHPQLPFQDLGVFPLLPRTPVQVSVRNPEGDPAENVVVVAEPIQALEGSSIPTFGQESLTSAGGTLALRLEPGGYRLDFNPGVRLPRASRFIRVLPAAVAEGQPLPQVLETVTLSRGRTVTGRILVAQGKEAPQPVANAMVRFFRVVFENGIPSNTLLAEGTTNDEGRYTLTLPTR